MLPNLASLGMQLGLKADMSAWPPRNEVELIPQ